MISYVMIRVSYNIQVFIALGNLQWICHVWQMWPIRINDILHAYCLIIQYNPAVQWYHGSWNGWHSFHSLMQWAPANILTITSSMREAVLRCMIDMQLTTVTTFPRQLMAQIRFITVQRRWDVHFTNVVHFQVCISVHHRGDTWKLIVVIRPCQRGIYIPGNKWVIACTVIHVL